MSPSTDTLSISTHKRDYQVHYAHAGTFAEDSQVSPFGERWEVHSVNCLGRHEALKEDSAVHVRGSCVNVGG